MAFNIWESPYGERVYFNHKYRGHNLKAWFEENEDTGEWDFDVTDKSPQSESEDAQERRRQQVRRELLEMAETTFQGLTGKSLAQLTYSEFRKVVKELKEKGLANRARFYKKRLSISRAKHLEAHEIE